MQQQQHPSSVVVVTCDLAVARWARGDEAGCRYRSLFCPGLHLTVRVTLAPPFTYSDGERCEARARETMESGKLHTDAADASAQLKEEQRGGGWSMDGGIRTMVLPP